VVLLLAKLQGLQVKLPTGTEAQSQEAGFPADNRGSGYFRDILRNVRKLKQAGGHLQHPL
jgi:hypothetical protein